jgi:N-acetylglucosaminyldiphosphoundecaprenol N-acetyl-beta-D-mannosaminyltransferase
MIQEVPPSPPDARIEQDFQRDVWCLFGLPVDNLTLEGTKHLLRERVKLPYNTVLSTINVNWVVQSFADPAFRAAIINSDIVTLDGKPLLWLAKLLGYPMTETVAGSTLIQELHQDKTTDTKLSIFLFGGEDDAAAQAAKEINKNPGGLYAVGSLNPGFGTVEEMSSDVIIKTINQTRPDILLVALGAKKGTQWIERNRGRLEAKIISHLGATINFLAGKVQRAPLIVRRIGMEWAWRILQEPKLFPRYATDGLILLRVLVSRFLLWRKYLYLMTKTRNIPVDTSVSSCEGEQELRFSFGKNLRLTKDSSFPKLFLAFATSRKTITLSFKQTEFVDGAIAGLLLLLKKHQLKNKNSINYTQVHDKLNQIFTLLGFSK